MIELRSTLSEECQLWKVQGRKCILITESKQSYKEISGPRIMCPETVSYVSHEPAKGSWVLRFSSLRKINT